MTSAGPGVAAAGPKTIFTILDYGDKYVQPLIEAAVATLKSSDVTLEPVASTDSIPDASSPCLCWQQYEALPFTALSSTNRTTLLLNSFVFRKALIRKHYLATTVRNWLVKHPSSILGAHVQPSVDFEVDYAEFLDDALVECYELNDSLARNAELQEPAQRQWWILKAGMAERGGGIRLFSTFEELSAIFEAWDPDDGDDDDDEVESGAEDDGKDIVTSQMRHFVAQLYLDKPLLLAAPAESAGRKFHTRTYVLASGALYVFVYKRMLALFAGPEYQRPEDQDDPNATLDGHLTNTCLQSGERLGSVHDFWSLPDGAAAALPGSWKQAVFEQICEVTGELFKAAAQGMSIHFQPLPNAFEIYGLDFLLDADGRAWLLEVNAFPDFAQTGPGLQSVVAGLMNATVDVAVKPFFGQPNTDAGSDMVEVLRIDLGKR